MPVQQVVAATVRSTPAAPRSRAVAWAAVAVLAVSTRLTTWADVLADGNVRLIPDGDPYYHVRRASMILEHGAIAWRDPWLNYPAGALIPWPPLFDLLVAGIAWTVGLGDPSPDTVSAVAVAVPVALGLASVALAAWLAAEIFGSREALGTAAVLAVSVPSIHYSLFGRADQHVLEILLFTAVALVFARGLRHDRSRAISALLLGAAIAISFWNWLGAAVTLAILGAACVIAGIIISPAAPQSTRAAKLLGWGSASAALQLVASIGLWGPQGALRSFTLGGLSAFQPALCGATALLAWSLLLGRSRSVLGRIALLTAIPSALLAAALLLLPQLREPVSRGLLAARSGNAWYGSIAEFMPLLFSGLKPVADEFLEAARLFGLWPLLGIVGFADVYRRLRRDADHREAIVLVLVAAVVFACATLMVKRFMLYGTVPLALLSWLGLSALYRASEARRPRSGLAVAGIAAALAVAPTTKELLGIRPDVSVSRDVEQALVRIRPNSTPAPRSAVFAPWYLGHHVLFYARRAVIASPFGVEGGEGAMRDAVALYSEKDPEAARQLLLRRGVQYVLLDDPVTEAAQLLGHGVRTDGAVRAPAALSAREIPSLVLYRLFYAAGSATPTANTPAVEGFRLVDEVQPDSSPVRLFELVPGATVRVRGGAPGRLLVARTDLTAPFGGRGAWQTTRVLDARGETTVQLPYATGLNGRIQASPFLIGDGQAAHPVTVSEHQVLQGETISVDLGDTQKRASRTRVAGQQGGPRMETR